jgi:very-short-patch-repair endonuclease
MTPSERILWKYIRGKQLDGWRFRRQHGFGPYVLDFYCPTLKLCIEVDGNIHLIDEIKQKDDDRTIFLEKNGFVLSVSQMKKLRKMLILSLNDCDCLY